MKGKIPQCPISPSWKPCHHFEHGGENYGIREKEKEKENYHLPKGRGVTTSFFQPRGNDVAIETSCGTIGSNEDPLEGGEAHVSLNGEIPLQLHARIDSGKRVKRAL